MRRLATLALLAIGCAHVSPRTETGFDEAPWRELRSQHFVVRTDVDRSAAESLVRSFEQNYAALAGVVLPLDGQAAGTVDVVLLRNREEYEHLVDPSLRGGLGFFRAAYERGGVMTLVLDEFAGPAALLANFRQDVVHRFVSYHFMFPPTWLDIGLASYYETIAVERGRLVMGALPYRLPLPRLRSVGELKIAMTDRFREDRDGMYESAWLLVHLLLNGPQAWRDRFERYVHALTEAPDWPDAWDAAFGDLSVDALDAELRRYHDALRKQVTLRAAPYAPPTSEIAVGVRELGPEAASVLEVELALPWRGADRKRLDAALDRARQLAPRAPEVRYWSARRAAADGLSRDAIVELRALVDERPDEPRYSSALADLLLQRNNLDEAAPLVARLERSAQEAVSLHLVARYHAARGDDLERAMVFEQRAMERAASWSPPYFFLEQLLERVGRVDEAAAMRERIGARFGGYTPESLQRANDRYELMAKVQRGEVLDDKLSPREQAMVGGMMLHQGMSSSHVPHALKLLRSSCGAGELFGCADLVETLCRNDLASCDEREARIVAERTCDLSNEKTFHTCEALAALLETDAAGAADLARALALHERLCDGKDRLSECFAAARLHWLGLGTARSDEQAFAWARKVGHHDMLPEEFVRDETERYAGLLGALYANGVLADKDDRRAVAFLRWACDEHDAAACALRERLYP